MRKIIKSNLDLQNYIRNYINLDDLLKLNVYNYLILIKKKKKL